MPEAAQHRKSKKLRRIALGLVIALLIIALVIAFFGPAILAAMAPAAVGRLGLPGKVELGDVSLSWFGELKVDDASLFDTDGSHIATVSLETGGGLFGLLDGSLNDDIVLDGWADVRMFEDGTTNIERALGLQRQPDADDAPEPDPAQRLEDLPFDRLVLDAVDAAFTRVGNPTLALAGLQGQVVSEGSALRLDADATLRMPPAPPDERQEITGAPEHGSLTLAADLSLDTLTGSAQVDIANLSEQAAGAAGSFTGSDAVVQAAAIAARDRLGLKLDAELQDGVPVQAVLEAASSSVKASLAMTQDDQAITLRDQGAVELDAAAFLASDELRSVLFPGQAVDVTQTGRISLTLEEFRVPMDGGSPNLQAMQARATIQADPTTLSVPGPDGQPTEVRLADIGVTAWRDAAGPLQATASLRAGASGQPDGVIQIDAAADLAEAMALNTEQRVDPTQLARILPRATLRLQSVPISAAKPWLGLAEQAGLNVQQIAGPIVTASLGWSGAVGGGADIDLMVQADHVDANLLARWTSEVVSLREPARITLARPGEIAEPWLAEDWSLENGQGVTIEVTSLSMPVQELLPDLAQSRFAAVVSAQGTKLNMPDTPTIGVGDLTLNVDADGAGTRLRLTSTPTVGDAQAQLRADLQTAGVGAFVQWDGMPQLTGTIQAQAPIDIVRAFDVQLAERSLEQWLAEAAGPSVTASLELSEPTADQLLAGTLTASAERAQVQARGLALSTSSDKTTLVFDSASLQATPDSELWQTLAPRIGLEGSSLATTSPLSLQVGNATFAFDAQGDWLQGLETTQARLAVEQPIRLDGVPLAAKEQDQPRRVSIVLANLSAEVNAIGKALSGGPDLQASLNVDVDSPDLGPVANIVANASTDQNGVMTANADITQLDTVGATSLAGLSETAAQAILATVGASASVDLSITATPASDQSQAWSLSNASASLASERLNTEQPLQVAFEPETIALAEPARLTWTPDADWLQQAIGARVTSVEPFRINLAQLQLGNPLESESGLLEPQSVLVEAGIDGKGAVIAIPDRPNIELETLAASIRRVAQSNYAITANAATAGGGTLALNGLVQEPTDSAGTFDLETAVVRATLKGNEVPVAIADALSNTDGLLADSLGPKVDLDAEISDGRLVPGRPPVANLRFSVRGPRADASGYGRLESHTIAMPEPQTILTVREVRPEVADRFSELIPELLMVEKRPEDGPAVIQTEGLRIPTNGDWSKGKGKATIALGTARFKTSSLLAQVLEVTGQREEGQVGRHVPPINISMEDGVITYEPFTLPLGDITIESEGTVNLVTNQMDVIVWLPKGSLADEAAGRFNTGLGSLVGQTVPGFDRLTTLPWRVTGPLDGPNIVPAPRVLIERRGQELFGPLLSPEQTIRDLLSIPRRKQSQPEGEG